jgi:effector-binding domain-containing protein
MARAMLIERMMRTLIKVLGALIAVLGVLAGIAIYLLSKGPDLSGYEQYREPALVTMAPQPMLVLERSGDPNQVGATVFKELFSLYYGVDDIPRGPPPAPRARWAIAAGAPKETWRGSYAMPVPKTVKAVPAPARLLTWSYGEVAQVLYEGPYSGEQATIEKLHAFIEQQGYQIAGEHEEEYLRGPTMFGRGDPAHYLTIIRYEVIKKEQTAPAQM